MNILNKIFKTASTTKKLGQVQLNGFSPRFTSWTGSAYENDIFRGAVDSIARNVAKLRGRHIITFKDDSRSNGSTNLNNLLQIEPNVYMSAYDFIYKLATHYFLTNNAFAYVDKDETGTVRGIYPLTIASADFLQDKTGELFIKFTYKNGNSYILPYSDVIHLRRHYNSSDLLGDDNNAIDVALSLAHAQNEGIINNIKSGVAIRGMLIYNDILGKEKLMEMKDNFVKDYLSIENVGGVVPLDSSIDYKPIESHPVAINAQEMAETKKKIYNYLGISEEIVNSSYTEDQWSAFYESIIEPLATQMSLEFTRKIFTKREKAFGNRIEFENNKLQFTSNKNKIELINYAVPMGVLTINEARETLNMPAMEDGDRCIQSLNYIDQKEATSYQKAKGGVTNERD